VGMRVIAAFFGLGTPQALSAPVPVCSYDCKRVERLAKHAISAYWEEVPTMQAKLQRCILGGLSAWPSW
jgi:hypothetical protein